ncbi:MAG: DNA polymerase IV [Chloroflexi bacterium]|nr:DNA polymerase IV [Chloroflexota bacterium]MCI0575853.1 DNA polymerase IV [Chloroflexota bacterium]MCI0646580.1 DNA polymerase IV [Chloroflexota bacterium]MCI0726382.1 DNA polymerase IV [Chloroflexota bacterium]
MIAWPRAVLHLDMDAFFANVHLLEHPEDVGIPVAVGGRPEHRGVVASASYEARKFGVRSAMPMATAVRLCPRLKIVDHNWPRIRDCSRQVMAVLAGYGPVEQMSVDEAYVDLGGEPEPERLAAAVRQQVKAEAKLPASVGLATSKLVAKVASDHDKPEGLTIVRPGEEAAFLAPLPVQVIWGIGPRTAERLARLGIERCGQLATAKVELLRAHFGRQADELQQRAQGIDAREVKSDWGLPKSISQEWTFSQDVNDPERLKGQLREMAARVADSLQVHNLVAHTVRVKFRWDDFTTFTRQKSVEVGVDQADQLYRLALAIWEEQWPPGQKMRLLGVAAASLKVVEARQIGFGF